jgi:hypothetical protein
MNKVYEEYLKNTNLENFDDNINEKLFEKEKYEKFYDLVNNVIIFFILNTYETIIKSNEEFDLDKINNKLSNLENIYQTLRLQLNIYWIEFNKKNNYKDQLIIDFDDLLAIDIIKHKLCLFKYIKNMCIFIVNKMAQIKLENLKTHEEFKDKIGMLANSILQINKITGLEDEDDFDCDECENKDYNEIFWN